MSGKERLPAEAVGSEMIAVPTCRAGDGVTWLGYEGQVHTLPIHCLLETGGTTLVPNSVWCSRASSILYSLCFLAVPFVVSCSREGDHGEPWKVGPSGRKLF